MKKQLNTTALTNELAGASAFFPSYKKNDSPTPQVAEVPVTIAPQNQQQQSDQPTPERANARTPVRSNTKRIITRNSFEIYEDQMDSLRELAYREKREGRIGSMSAMVREAVDSYLKENNSG